MKKLSASITLLLMLFSGSAQAVTEYDQAVNSVGVGLNLNPVLTGNFKPANKLSSDCPYGMIYFDATSDIGKAMYSTLLMAKAGNKKLSRIDYFQPGEGLFCTLSYVEVAE